MPQSLTWNSYVSLPHLAFVKPFVEWDRHLCLRLLPQGWWRNLRSQTLSDLGFKGLRSRMKESQAPLFHHHI